MWFRQMSVFGLPADFALAAADLEDALAANPLAACGAHDLQCTGWVPAGPHRVAAEDAVLPMLHTVDGQHLLALGVEEKLLPASVVRQHTEQRAAKLEAAQGHPPGRRQWRELREQVADELCTRALTRRRSTRAWLDPGRRRLVIDTASNARVEQFLGVLRDTLRSFDAPPFATREVPRQAMAGWLRSGHAPQGFGIDVDVELRGTTDARRYVRYARHAMAPQAVHAYLDAGLAPTRLGLTWRDRVAFVLSDTLSLRRVQFVGLGADDADGVAAEERFDNDFALMAGELSRLIDDLAAGLGGVAAPADRDARHGTSG
jgi:recombination associated protein RdgC